MMHESLFSSLMAIGRELLRIDIGRDNILVKVNTLGESGDNR